MSNCVHNEGSTSRSDLTSRIGPKDILETCFVHSNFLDDVIRVWLVPAESYSEQICQETGQVPPPNTSRLVRHQRRELEGVYRSFWHILLHQPLHYSSITSCSIFSSFSTPE